MNWYKVAEFSAELDLSEVHRYFQHRGLVHRFTEKRGMQELWVADERLLEDARHFIESWRRGEVDLPAVEEPPEPARETQARPYMAPARYPLTLVIMVCGLMGYLLYTFFTNSAMLPALTFQPFRVTAAGPEFTPAIEALRDGEVWRLVTPAFLHFNVLHIVFNALWIWEFGRRLEVFFSKGKYLLIFLVTAVGANVLQYLSASDSLFGGLSGVLYGYLGVLFVAHRIAPHPILAVPPGIFIFMFIWLALGVFGVIDMFIPGPGAVGNGAHLGGLFAGLVLGYLLLIGKRGKPSARY